MDAIGNCYLTAAWLFWTQAACQAYPLPRNIGRGAVAATIALFAAEASDRLQIRLLCRLLQLIAIATLVIALATMIADSNLLLPRWLILVFLATYLWVSTRQQDLRDWVVSIHVAHTDPAFEHLYPADESSQPSAKQESAGDSAAYAAGHPWLSECLDSIRMRHKRRAAKEALRREHEEASDAARLDQVLERVGQQGPEGLSREDRALLERVSENLRRRRESGDAAE